MIKDFLKKMKWESLFTALFAVVIGVLFLVFPSSSSYVLCYTAGAIFIILGTVYIIRYITGNYILGSYALLISILLLIVGIFCLIRPNTIKAIITVIFGIFLIVDGIIKMQEGIEYSRVPVKGWWTVIMFAMASIALGIVVMFGTFESVMIFAGVSLILDGIFDFITTLVFSTKLKKAEKTVKQVIKETIEDTNDNK